MRRLIRTMVLFFTICLTLSFFPGITGTAFAASEGISTRLNATIATQRAVKSNSAKIKYSDGEISQIVSLLYRKPKEKEYLDEYFNGRIDNNGYSVYAYNSPDAKASKLFEVEDGEELTVIAYYRNNDRYCVIVNAKNRACWINAAYITMIAGDSSASSQDADRADSAKIKYTEKEINQIVASLYRKPKGNEYLDEYFPGKIDHDGYSVYAFNSPDAKATKLFEVEDGEELTVIAYYKTNDRYCVIVNAKNRACWINASYISIILDESSSASQNTHRSDATKVKYTEKEIDQIVSTLYRKPKENEYLDVYFRGRIEHDGYSVYAFNSPDAKASKLFEVEDGEELTVIAYYRNNDRYCVIVNAKNRACWINAAYISMILDRDG